MHIGVVLVTVNKSIYIRTLHALMRINLFAISNNHIVELTFVDKDPFLIKDALNNGIKKYDKLLLLDYGIFIDQESIETLNKDVQNHGMIIYPCVKEGVDWELFKNNMNDEPITQAGLQFDTSVGKKIIDGFYKVEKSEPKVWCLDCKKVSKKFSFPVKRSELIPKLKEDGVKICVFSKAKIITSYVHECYGSIVQAAGVSSSK